MRKWKRYHIISVRVSDEEREALDTISLKTKKNVSELMRDALKILAPGPAPGPIVLLPTSQADDHCFELI